VLARDRRGRRVLGFVLGLKLEPPRICSGACLSREAFASSTADAHCSYSGLSQCKEARPGCGGSGRSRERPGPGSACLGREQPGSRLAAARPSRAAQTESVRGRPGDPGGTVAHGAEGGAYLGPHSNARGAYGSKRKPSAISLVLNDTGVNGQSAQKEDCTLYFAA